MSPYWRALCCRLQYIRHQTVHAIAIVKGSCPLQAGNILWSPISMDATVDCALQLIPQRWHLRVSIDFTIYTLGQILASM